MFLICIEALNTNNHTFEVAPVFILVEQAIIKYLMELLSWDTEVWLYTNHIFFIKILKYDQKKYEIENLALVDVRLNLNSQTSNKNPRYTIW